jgi:transcriptional regulator with XRE-family HTH domain
MDRDGLADFLRRRREALRPADVGLGEGRRRRTAGLRREEVAALASMSTDFYTRLEQRRGSRPSASMVAAIARALRLTLDERDHLFRLAGHEPPPRGVRTEHVSPALMRVLDRLDTPAQVTSDLGVVLVQNPLAQALLGVQTEFTGLSRSVYHRWFTDPGERERWLAEDHGVHSRSYVASLRDAYREDDPDARALVGALLDESPEFAALWSLHEVGRRTDTRKRIAHPLVGLLELDCQILRADNDAQLLVVFTASPGSESADRLELLSVLGSQRFEVEHS